MVNFHLMVEEILIKTVDAIEDRQSTYQCFSVFFTETPRYFQ